MMSDWVKAVAYHELQQKQSKIFRHQGKQIALFATPEGIYACNNRCPHEGYPLREGTLDDSCILTCNWHNWKFDLKTGANLYGGDKVRVYPVELRDGEVWIDLSEAPLEQRRSEILRSLHDAFDDHEYDRIARELGRFRLIGADPLDTLREAIHWSYDKLEFGWTHAYAGMADWLILYDEYADEPETRLICLLESIGHIADDILRETTHPYPQDMQAYDEDRFVQAIDEENQLLAIAMLRGALADGLHFADLEKGVSRAALLHYADFGHSLIYTSKAGQLIERLGESVELPLLLALIRSLVFGWREDKIPEFRGYAAALAGWENNKAAVKKQSSPSVSDFRQLSVDKALELAVDCRTAPAESLYAALLGANAAQLLNYDINYQYHVDKQVADNVGWLSFTHGITFANAVHKQCRKFPELWPAGLLQMACFSGRNRPYTDDGVDGSRWAVDDIAGFFRDQTAALFDHGKEEYIVSVHLLKTLLAAREEADQARADETKQLLAAGLNRFLHSPLKRKHVRRTARQALQFVAKDG
jgi:nitrite reductase/ring-hydroxylating ferredoxin subunit